MRAKPFKLLFQASADETGLYRATSDGEAVHIDVKEPGRKSFETIKILSRSEWAKFANELDLYNPKNRDTNAARIARFVQAP